MITFVEARATFFFFCTSIRASIIIGSGRAVSTESQLPNQERKPTLGWVRWLAVALHSGVQSPPPFKFRLRSKQLLCSVGWLSLSSSARGSFLLTIRERQLAISYLRQQLNITWSLFDCRRTEGTRDILLYDPTRAHPSQSTSFLRHPSNGGSVAHNCIDDRIHLPRAQKGRAFGEWAPSSGMCRMVGHGSILSDQSIRSSVLGGWGSSSRTTAMLQHLVIEHDGGLPLVVFLAMSLCA